MMGTSAAWLATLVVVMVLGIGVVGLSFIAGVAYVAGVVADRWGRVPSAIVTVVLVLTGLWLFAFGVASMGSKP